MPVPITPDTARPIDPLTAALNLAAAERAGREAAERALWSRPTPRRPATKIVGYRQGFPIKEGERFLVASDAPKRPRKLPPSRPNVGIKVAYRSKLERLIDQMAASVTYWVKSVYRAHEPIIAKDELAPIPPIVAAVYDGGHNPWLAVVNGEPLVAKSGKPRKFKTEAAARAAARIAVGEVLPADELAAALEDLGAKWSERFANDSEPLARWFATAAARRTDEGLRLALRQAGVSVRFQPTRAAMDAVAATTQANVSLIKSIPAQYLTQVEGAVMRSVQTGRDLGTLTKELQKNFGVTRRRAEFIARDQNNKATATITKVRQEELGVEDAEWVHSGAGLEPRPTHVKNDGKKYDVKKGWYDPAIGRWIWPGTEPGCRCTSRIVFKGLSR